MANIDAIVQLLVWSAATFIAISFFLPVNDDTTSASFKFKNKLLAIKILFFVMGTVTLLFNIGMALAIAVNDSALNFFETQLGLYWAGMLLTYVLMLLFMAVPYMLMVLGEWYVEAGRRMKRRGRL